MSRKIIISDIHGCLDEFNRLLNLVNYSEQQDQLLLLGDYVDRGPQSKEVVEAVMKLAELPNVIVLRGNHDQRFVDLIKHNSEELYKKFVDHGGIDTIKSYTQRDYNTSNIEQCIAHIQQNYHSHISFLESLPLYYEDHNHIYVHAGINPNIENWKQQSAYDFMYLKEQFYNYDTKVDKLVVFGHTKTIDIHGNADVWFSKDKIGVDGGCSFGMQLNALIIENGQYETASIKRINT